MPRQPKLRKRKIGNSVYWFSEAGGETFFGNTKKLAHKDANRLINHYHESLLDAQQDRKSQDLTVADRIRKVRILAQQLGSLLLAELLIPDEIHHLPFVNRQLPWARVVSGGKAMGDVVICPLGAP
jgi:hypothetical protein